MGIPKFYRWLSERCPMLSTELKEGTAPEIDNLYLDMNGIIHRCTHANTDKQIAFSEKNMMLAIFAFVDRLFSLIKPKKLLFLAVDGVAPRAKQNQQRQRRFRAAQAQKELREEMIAKGESVPEEDDVFDPNCITPGTPFMIKLAKHLQFFIRKKITDDRSWREVQVLYSGHDVPGEGEHKIMELIRGRKMQPGYMPNERHCLYGLDADLIMLSLLTHEPHFCLLREEVQFGPSRVKDAPATELQKEDKLELLHISLLREYLDLEFQQMELPGGHDVERCIDDFIFLCFFVGNDFLPHSPTLDIAEGAINILLDIYKVERPNLPGYITQGSNVDFARVEHILRAFSSREQEILDERVHSKAAALTRRKRFQKKPSRSAPAKEWVSTGPSTAEELNAELQKLKLADESGSPSLQHGAESAFYSMLEEEEECGVVERAGPGGSGEGESSEDAFLKQKSKANEDLILRLMESGDGSVSVEEWRRMYYMQKLGWDVTTPDGALSLEDMKRSYVEGLIWVMRYYYNGCSSWGWFYPFHYSPLVSDLTNLASLASTVQLEMGAPHLPFRQLLSVLPAASYRLLPPAYHWLVFSPDSPIIEYFPETFVVDLEGKRNDWEGVALIPFIDSDRMTAALELCDPKLTKEEQERNRHGITEVFEYSRGANEAVECSLGIFSPSLGGVSTREFHMPDGTDFVPALVPGVRLGADTLPGYPSLARIPFSSELRKDIVNLFGFPTKKHSWILSPSKSPRSADACLHWLDGSVFVDYPFLEEAQVVMLMDAEGSYERGFPESKVPHNLETHKTFESAMSQLRSHFLTKKGIDLGKIRVLVFVKKFESLSKDMEGNLVQNWRDQTTVFPAQLVMEFDVSKVDQKKSGALARPLEYQFPVGSEVGFLGDKYYGSIGTVDAVSDTLTLTINVLEGEPDFSAMVRKMDTERFITASELGARCGLTPLVVSQIASTLKVANIEIGLQIKFQKRMMHRQGLAKAVPRADGSTQWLYGATLVPLLSEYRKKFPEVFEHAEAWKSRNLDPRQLFRDCDSYKRLQELEHWLQTKRTMLEQFPFVDVGSEVLSKDAIEEYERVVDDFLSHPRTVHSITLANVSPALVMSFDDRSPHTSVDAPLESQFELGDRVMSCSLTSSSPLGARGILVGKLDDSTCQVVFDIAFMGGSSLDGRCSELRGRNVPYDSLLNLSQPIRRSGHQRVTVLKDIKRMVGPSGHNVGGVAGSSSGSTSAISHSTSSASSSSSGIKVETAAGSVRSSANASSSATSGPRQDQDAAATKASSSNSVQRSVGKEVPRKEAAIADSSRPQKGGSDNSPRASIPNASTGAVSVAGNGSADASAEKDGPVSTGPSKRRSRRKNKASKSGGANQGKLTTHELKEYWEKLQSEHTEQRQSGRANVRQESNGVQKLPVVTTKEGTRWKVISSFVSPPAGLSFSFPPSTGSEAATSSATVSPSPRKATADASTKTGKSAPDKPSTAVSHKSVASSGRGRGGRGGPVAGGRGGVGGSGPGSGRGSGPIKRGAGRGGGAPSSSTPSNNRR